jgi:type IV pilus assembly protein PilC
MFFDKRVDEHIENFLKERELWYFNIKQKVFLFRELSYLIEGGVAIVDSVLIIKNGSDKGAIRKICDEMYFALNRGETLSLSMGLLPRYFNQGDVNIVKSGEESGELTLVLKYLAEEYEFLHNIKTKYMSAMIYPGVLFSMAIISVYVLFTKILPGIFEIVTQFDAQEIPATTKAMMGMTTFLQENTLEILMVMGLWWFILWVIFSTQRGQRTLDQYIFKLPLIGKVTQYYDMIKFMRYMRLLMQAGMNFLDVFIFLREIMANITYKEAIDDVIGAINRGETIGDTLAKYTQIISKDVVALLKVGEETASFESALSNAIRMYEDEFEKQLDGLSKAIEPILIVFIGWVIAMVAMSVFGMIGTLLDSITV